MAVVFIVGGHCRWRTMATYPSWFNVMLNGIHRPVSGDNHLGVASSAVCHMQDGPFLTTDIAESEVNLKLFVECFVDMCQRHFSQRLWATGAGTDFTGCLYLIYGAFERIIQYTGVS